MFSDTHCHLNHAEFDADRAEVLLRARDAGVSRMLCIGWDSASSQMAVRIARAEPDVFACVGIHPESADEWQPGTFAALREFAADPLNKVRAWGEIGLDYYRDSIPHAVQQEVFAAQIDAARHVSPSLPLVIHCREAFDDVLSVLQNSGTPAPVVLHCWTGNAADARRALDAGCFFGFGGVVTYKKSEDVREAARIVPLDKMLLETDCPYLAPVPFRGRRNEPSCIPHIAQAIADAKSLPLETVALETSTTARALFGW